MYVLSISLSLHISVFVSIYIYICIYIHLELFIRLLMYSSTSIRVPTGNMQQKDCLPPCRRPCAVDGSKVKEHGLVPPPPRGAQPQAGDQSFRLTKSVLLRSLALIYAIAFKAPSPANDTHPGRLYNSWFET